MLKYLIIGCPAILVLVAFVLNALFVFDVLYLDGNKWPRANKYEALENLPEAKIRCKKILHDDRALPFEAEDPIYYSDNIILFASGGLYNMIREGRRFPGNEGNLYIYDVEENKVLPLRCPNFEPQKGFIPHGMYYSRITGRLYVINHFGAETESTIEVFRVMTQSNSKYPLLKRLGAIHSNFKFGTINNLVEVSNNELYVTVYASESFPENGKLGNKTLVDIWHDIKLPFELTWPIMYKTGFMYCRFDVNNLDQEQQCTRVEGNTKFAMANGITLKRGKEHHNLYVADTVANVIEVFQVPTTIQGPFDPSSILRQVVHKDTFKVIDGLDNIHYDSSRDIIVGAGGPVKYLGVEMMLGNPNMAPGSMVLVNPTTGESRRALYHNGRRLSVLSGCIFASQSNNDTAVCGSPFSKGLLRCSLN